MPGISGPGGEPPEKRRFINEKIVRPPLSRGQIAKRGILLVAAAVIFGAVAAVTFVISRPFAERYLAPESETETIPITIPKDEPETMATTAAIVETSPAETEPIEEVLKSAMEKYQYTSENLSALYGSLRTVCQEADRGIVTVHSVKQTMDWFDNPVENTGLYAGLIIASTSGELLVLTPEAAVEEADSIKVAFTDGSEAAGSIKQKDKISGLAIVSISRAAIDSELLETLKPVELGNSYSVKQGDLVIAIGSPAGMVHSTGYGVVSYVTRNAQIIDGMTRIIYADLKSNAVTGTFLMNISGEVVGWATDAYKNEGSKDMTAVVAISDYKSILEKMTNGDPVPYLGIQGQEVSSALNESGIPLGIYVVNPVADSPVYNAGIQSGDIITKINGKRIVTMKDYQVELENLKQDEQITITIERNGREEYKELEYQVIVGAR